MQLDLNLIPIARYAGQEHPELLGLHTANAPRRAARGRSGDRLILYMVMEGNAPLPPAKQTRVLSDLAVLYFETAGSVTSGMRVVAEELNALLQERNLRLSSSGRQGTALLVQIVLRGDQVYLAQSGGAHSFLLAEEGVQHFYDPDMEGRGVGQGRTAPIAYHQVSLKPNDTLLLSALPAPDWNVSSLSGLHGQGPESLRRKLFQGETMELNAVMVQARPGQGRFYLPPPRSASAAKAPAVVAAPPESTDSLSVPETQPEINEAAPPVTAAPPADMQPEAASQVDATSEFPESEATALADGFAPVPDPTADDLLALGGLPDRARKSRPREPRVRNALAKVLLPVLNAFQRLGEGISSIFERLLPGDVSSIALAFIALAVPVVVVTVASVVYFQLGRDAQYEILYARAASMAADARRQDELETRRAAWLETLDTLDEVEAYAQNEATQLLRVEANEALDEMDLVKRVDYQPAIVGGLPPEMQITRMVVSESDLYLLDSYSGNVIRAMPTAQGFIVDTAFKCGPGLIGVTEVGPLIDILTWPAGFVPDAAILALDDRGTAVYCSPDTPPEVETLVESSTQASGNPTAILLDVSDLYVLDPMGNAIWVYWGSNVGQEPSLFFDEVVPALQDIADLTANSRELYLLHQDGRVTICSLGVVGVTPTRCTDTPYIDYRPGRQGKPLTPDSPYSQIMFTPPPDPSLFVLEPARHAINHFSLRNLAFQRSFLPGQPLSSQPATAFFVSPVQRMLYLAIGHEVFYGIMP